MTSVVVCPLDVLKTRLQVAGRNAAQHHGLSAGLKDIVRNEGVAGLYRGLSPTLLALLPNWAVYFTIYERLKTSLRSEHLPEGSARLHVVSAAGAGATTMCVANPMWVIKTRLQAQGLGIQMGRRTATAMTAAGEMPLTPVEVAAMRDELERRAKGEGLGANKPDALGKGVANAAKEATASGAAASAPAAKVAASPSTPSPTTPKLHPTPRVPRPHVPVPPLPHPPLGGTRYKGLVDAATKIVKYEGLSGLYAGLLPSLMGVSHVVIQFPLYEKLKAETIARHGPGGPKELAWYELTACAMASKLVASSITYPHEVVRARMHVSGAGAFDGFGDACREIIRSDGIRGFYHGCGINLMRTVPAAAVTFVAFEYVHAYILKWVNADPHT